MEVEIVNRQIIFIKAWNKIFPSKFYKHIYIVSECKNARLNYQYNGIKLHQTKSSMPIIQFEYDKN